MAIGMKKMENKMSLGSMQNRKIGMISILLFFCILLLGKAYAQAPDLEVFANDTIAYPNSETTISIYMNNYSDTVSGIEVLLVLERPDIMQFIVESGTVYDTLYWKCIYWIGDSCAEPVPATSADYEWFTVEEYQSNTGTIDKTGTLIEGWEGVYAAALGGYGNNLKITGVADICDEVPNESSIAPQSGGLPLIKIPVQIYEIPDLEESINVGVYVMADNLDNFAFSNNNGFSFGVVKDTVEYQTCYHCLYWYSEECLLWDVVSCDSADLVDSTWCCDTLYEGILDTNLVRVTNGSVEILPTPCGDVNLDFSINIIDITYLINYLYKGGAAPPVMNAADVNNSGDINILDITYLIAYLYLQGEQPDCP